MGTTIVGMDAGGTLLKAAYYERGHLHVKKYPYSELHSLLEWISFLAPGAEFKLTGGRAAFIQDQLGGARVQMIDEFAAVTQGVKHLLGASSPLMKKGFILANIGTGTSIHYISADESERLAGSGMGGGTFMGLASILAGSQDFKEIMSLAENGHRGTVDLQVKDIYAPAEPPIPGHFTASNFGKASGQDGSKKEDLMAALTGMIAETVVLLSTGTARLKDVQDILYIGNTITGSPHFKESLKAVTEIFGFRYHELERGEYSGAIGALLS
ncbi:type II pantothenate kinase [Peribacillus sp. SCS-26]|uniref:type II pantothenate kinase n=1 Tax=Paraperibacillus marinus TaxID=3115295 RepID=UPI003905CC1F